MDYVPHNVTLTFNGTAISVYCIIANLVESDITTFTNISFEMDGAPAGHYVHTPNKGNFEYNVTVYSVAGLSNEQHTLIMTAAQGTSPSLVLFDWAMYTYDDAEASTSSVDASSPQSGTLISPSYTTTTEANLTTIPPDVLTVTLTASSETPGSLGTGGSSASSTGPLSSSSSSSSTSGVPSATKTGAAVGEYRLGIGSTQDSSAQ
ncbi:hypothetical protein EVJ58_g1953 [Rhodofomes roseus]|uniref:Uncharacterized protein n=1 Tax=Rhodofomes roseus TaxID=34475 RepID=A0A4Y9YSY2_9APHY|nr:hypothetical protein EVJ58_g1953 [Rhodofomes roseus]